MVLMDCSDRGVAEMRRPVRGRVPVERRGPELSSPFARAAILWS